MKPHVSFGPWSMTISLGVLCLVLGLTTAQGQNFSLEWFSLGGGATTSTGGTYSASAVIGQITTGTINGGDYSAVGDFWTITPLIQTFNAPALQVTNLGGTIIISWDKIAGDFELDSTSTLDGSVPWSAVSASYQTNSTDIFISEPAAENQKFYRLRKSQ